MFDDAWVTATKITMGPSLARHLNNEGVIGRESETAVLNTFTNFFPATSFGKFLGIGTKTLNIAEFSSKFKGLDILKGTAELRGLNCLKYNYPIRVSNAFTTHYDMFNYGLLFAPIQQINMNIQTQQKK